MRLSLIRIYASTGTNGYLIHGKELICKTIELPWYNNKRSISCIPEGIYVLVDRYSQRFGRHLLVKDVPNRDPILFHCVEALTAERVSDEMLTAKLVSTRRELRGCIAPVSELTGPGRGAQSRVAMRKLLDRVLPVLDKQEQIILNIYS